MYTPLYTPSLNGPDPKKTPDEHTATTQLSGLSKRSCEPRHPPKVSSRD